ncbi:uncharacterized protein METZ01_LOCUS296261 [marine metagenome]|uniref:Macroglobulin domain-containing protein n=1 Tax=marine metagenome TaxID=408172 RepID=A0A382M6U5_9ZZZZ
MKAILLFALSAIILSQSYGFAYGATISVATDSSSYEAGEMISVSGSVSDYDESDPFKNFDVTLKVLAPNNNVVSISQIPLNSDGSYSTFIPAQGPLWKYDGDYTISVSWGSDNNASTTFTFISEPEEIIEEVEQEEVIEISEEELAEEVEETETPEPTSVSTPASGFNAFAYSIVFTVAIAFGIMIILYAVSRGSRTKTA